MVTPEPTPVRPELSFIVDVTQIPSAGREYQITAKEAERVRVAKRLDLLELPQFSAKIVLAAADGGLVRVTGSLAASVVQECVVTLEPVPAKIEADFEMTYTRTLKTKIEHELDILPDDDAPDALVGDELDLGEIMVEQLALVLDPYPRAPGAVFGTRTIGRAEDPNPKVSPFAVLAKLKTNNKNN